MHYVQSIKLLYAGLAGKPSWYVTSHPGRLSHKGQQFMGS